jgi:Flp pilus assembly protein TadD
MTDQTRLLNEAQRKRLEEGLRGLFSFGSLEVHPPAVGSEPFFDGRSLSFPLKGRSGEDIALVVLGGVESLPGPGQLVAACAALIAADGGQAAEKPARPKRPHVVEVRPSSQVLLEVAKDVAPGQRMLIWERQADARRVYKAEAEVVSVQEGRAVARIAQRTDPFEQVKAGDLIAPIEAKGNGDGPGSGGGLAAFEAALARECANWERFAVLAARLEGAELVRTRFGGARREALLAEMSKALLGFGGTGTVVGRQGGNVILAAFPEKIAAEALVAHAKLATLAGAVSAAVTAGCAAYPAWDYGRQEATANALKALDHARLLGPGQTAAFNAVSLNVSGDGLYAKGDLEGAATEYARALTIDPEDTNVLNSLGVCYATLGRPDDARAQFEKAIAVCPAEVMAHYNLGFLHLKQGEKVAARERFQAACDVDPANFEVRLQLGKLLLQAGRGPEAKEHLLAAAAVESRPYIHRHLGDCLLLLGDSGEAAAHYKRAVRSDPDDAHSLSQLAAVYLEQGSDLEVAVSLLRKSIELQPGRALHRERLEAALGRLGQES